MKNMTLCAFALCGAVALTATGCITNTMYGCEVVETLAAGATEGDVIAKHGAPDNIVYLGTQWENPNTGERGVVDKYLFEYRIGGGTTLLGTLMATDSFQNICYLIENGRVMGGARRGEGAGTIILGMFGFGGFLHPKARAGYGGDGAANLGAAAGGSTGGLFGLGMGPL